MRNKMPLKIITLFLFILSLTLGIIGYKYKIDHPEYIPYIVLGDKNGKELFNIYKNLDGTLCMKSKCEGELYLIIKNIDGLQNARIISGNEKTKYLLIENGSLRLINLENRKEDIIDISGSSYSLILENGKTYNQDNLDLEPIGITFSKDNQKYFYNTKIKKIMYENYKNLSVLNEYYLINREDDKITLLAIHEENVILEIETQDSTSIIKNIETENGMAYITIANETNTLTYEIYDLESKKKIVGFTGEFEKITRTPNKIIAISSDEALVYNTDGTLSQRRKLSSSDKYNMIDNYYVTVEKGNLLLIDLETNEEKNLMEMTSNSHLDRIYKDVITKSDGTTSQALRIVVREINTNGNITKTYDIFYDLKTKEVKIIED